MLEQRVLKLERNIRNLEQDNYTLQLEKRYNNYLDYGPTFVLKHIHFTRKGSRILPSSYTELNELAMDLRSKDDMVIRIICHTDDLGSPEYNYRLSLKRLQTIQEYLIGKGAKKEQVVGVGQGEYWPISTINTWNGRKENRRVEIQVAMR